MKRIKLKELLNVTEQAPQPPAPAPAPAAPPAPAPATPEAPAPEGDVGPTPDNPNEYDFTKDFRTFETTVEKSKQAAKKKFLDKLNQTVVNKKVTVNASRGFGQPQKDYTIDNVKKASVDWAYNKNVVTLTDDNDKEYILTPGVDIKIEQPAPEQPEAPAPEDKAPEAAPKPSATPSAPPAEAPKPEAPAEQPAQPGTAAPKPEEPAAEENPELAALKKKKKVAPQPAPVAEEVIDEADGAPYPKDHINRDFGAIFQPFMADPRARFDLTPYFKGGTVSGDGESWGSEVRFEIPADKLSRDFDMRDFKLAVKDEMYHYSGPGQSFSHGSVDVTKHGRYYVFEFSERGGLDI